MDPFFSLVNPYHYRGGRGEVVPLYVTRVIVAGDVEVIRTHAFTNRRFLVSVVMEDATTIIDRFAFQGCVSLRRIRFSRILDRIRRGAFYGCSSLEVLFLPRSITRIGFEAFRFCRSLKLFVLSENIELANLSELLIAETKMEEIAEANNSGYGKSEPFLGRRYSLKELDRLSSPVNVFLMSHMLDAEFHRLCLDPNVSVAQIGDYLEEHGDASAEIADSTYDMMPLHILVMNPNVEDAAIERLFNANAAAIFHADFDGKTPLDYAREYNIGASRALVNAMMLRRP